MAFPHLASWQRLAEVKSKSVVVVEVVKVEVEVVVVKVETVWKVLSRKVDSRIQFKIYKSNQFGFLDNHDIAVRPPFYFQRSCRRLGDIYKCNYRILEDCLSQSQPEKSDIPYSQISFQ